MINLTKLYCGTVEASDPLRYGRQSGKLPSHLLQFSSDKKPVVVWNCTKQCNLFCVHCYATATRGPAPDELTSDEAKAILEDEKCVGCGLCSVVCPSDAIHFDEVRPVDFIPTSTR